MGINKPSLLPYLSLLTATLLWSSSFIALKLAFEFYDPMVVIFGRMLIAFLFILIVLKPLRRIRFKVGDVKYLLFMGICEPCLYFVFEAIALPTSFEPVPAFAIIFLGIFVTFGAYGSYNFAVSKIPASKATAFINLIPVFTVILGVLILGDQLTVMQMVAVLVVFAGIYVSNTRRLRRARSI